MLRAIHHKATVLGPTYDCLHCTKPEKDLTEGCPKCPLTITFNRVPEWAGEEIRRVLDEEPDHMELEQMTVIFKKASAALADTASRIDPEWSFHFGAICRVVLYEQNRQDYSQNWTTLQKVKG